MKNILFTFLFIPLIFHAQEDGNYINQLISSAEKKIDNNNFSGAIADLNLSINQNPNLFYAYYLRGYSYSNIDEPEYYKVLSDLNKFLNNSNNFSDDLIGYAYYLRGISNNNIGDVKSALNDLKLSIEYYPNFAPSYRYRAGINFETFWNLDYNFKKKFFKVARSLTGFNQMLGYDIISDCKKSLELEPDNAYAYYIMGRYKERLSLLSIAVKSKLEIPNDWGCSDLKQGAILGSSDSRKWYEESSCF